MYTNLDFHVYIVHSIINVILHEDIFCKINVKLSKAFNMHMYLLNQ